MYIVASWFRSADILPQKHQEKSFRGGMDVWKARLAQYAYRPSALWCLIEKSLSSKEVESSSFSHFLWDVAKTDERNAEFALSWINRLVHDRGDFWDAPTTLDALIAALPILGSEYLKRLFFTEVLKLSFTSSCWPEEALKWVSLGSYSGLLTPAVVKPALDKTYSLIKGDNEKIHSFGTGILHLIKECIRSASRDANVSIAPVLAAYFSHQFPSRLSETFPRNCFYSH